MDTSNRCLEPVVVSGVFSPATTDTGHRCVRAAGHEGVHRWMARWENLSPAEVEAEIQRDLDTWERDEDERDDTEK